MAVKGIDPMRCIGCKVCMRSCPADVFRFDTDTCKAYVKYARDCQLCLWCITLCPRDAITLTKDKDFPVYTCWG